MERTNRMGKEGAGIAVVFVKCLLAAYLLTGGALLLLALLLYRFQLPESAVNIGILIIYALSNFAAGFLIGKCVEERRFLWGFLAGLLYFAVLALVSFAANQSFKDVGNHFFTTLMICCGSGMLGGMIS